MNAVSKEQYKQYKQQRENLPEEQGEFSVFEEWLHSITHGIGAVLSLVGMVVLLVAASYAAHVDPWKIVSLSLYGTTLVLLYTASTLYHGIPHRRWKQRFQLLDHCDLFTHRRYLHALFTRQYARHYRLGFVCRRVVAGVGGHCLHTAKASTFFDITCGDLSAHGLDDRAGIRRDGGESFNDRHCPTGRGRNYLHARGDLLRRACDPLQPCDLASICSGWQHLSLLCCL